MIAFDVNKKQKTINEKKVVIKSLGLISDSKKEEINEEILKIVIEKYDQLKDERHREIINGIRKKIERRIFRLINKEPLVAVVISENY